MSGTSWFSVGAARRRFLRNTFSVLSAVGRPIGGIRPRRITNWVGREAYDGSARDAQLWRWVRDEFGSELRLHPAYFIDRQIMSFGAYEHALHRMLERAVQAGAVCFDVGAHIGSVAVHMARRAGPSGAVHCFEPHPQLRFRLEENIARNGLASVCHVHPFALSDRSGDVELYVANEGDSNQGTSSIVGPGEFDQLVNSVSVPMQSMDELVESLGIRAIDVVKVDIQGAELLWLEGARQTLSRADAPVLALEISPGDLRHGDCTGPELVARVESVGYRVYTLTDAGVPGSQIRASTLSPEFSAPTVICTKR